MAHGTLVSIEDLAAHLDDPAWVVCDCRHDLVNYEAGRSAYAESHIPGARFLHLDEDLSGPKTGLNGRHPLPHPITFTLRLGALGIDNATQVVAYDASGGCYAARLWWMLRWVGHERAAVLDGGWAAWTKAGRPATAALPECRPTTFNPSLQPARATDSRYIAGHLREVQMVDAAGGLSGASARLSVPRARERPYLAARSRVTYLPTAEHDELRAMVRELAEERIAPRAAEIDEKAEFPWDLKELLAQQDLLGTCFEERHGGTSLDTIAQSIVAEEIARADATTSLIPIVQKLGALPIILAGSEEQKDRYFPRLASGEWLIAFGLTEAASGSDVASNRMRAVREGDCYVLNGSKRFITHGSVANVLTVFALTDPEAGGRKGMSAFIVEADTPGFAAPRVEHKMGIRGSPTAELTFDDVRVPIENRLGEEGDGFKIAMATLDRSRLGIAAQAVGIGQGALDAAVAYAADRQQFGQRVVDFQGIQWMLADMATAVEAARQLTYAAAARVDANAADLPYWTSSAKLVAGDAAMRVTTDAVQVLGGYGYISEYPVERMMRDAKITQLYEGTQQIQRLIVARQLLQRAGVARRG